MPNEMVKQQHVASNHVYSVCQISKHAWGKVSDLAYISQILDFTMEINTPHNAYACMNTSPSRTHTEQTDWMSKWMNEWPTSNNKPNISFHGNWGLECVIRRASVHLGSSNCAAATAAVQQLLLPTNGHCHTGCFHQTSISDQWLIVVN